MLLVDLTEEQRAELLQVSRQAAGRVALRAVQFGVQLSCSTGRRALHQMGWRWRRPRLTPASVLPSKHDPEDATKLAATPRLHALWLPKYAAHECNPVERSWGLMNDDVAANRLAGSIDELTRSARRFFADLAPHPVSLANPPALAAVA